MTTLNEKPTQIYTCTAVEFELGLIVISKGLGVLIGGSTFFLFPSETRHKNGDWGNVSIERKIANDKATREGLSIRSEYNITGERVRVVTNADRSETRFSLVSEH
ncbi:conserved hypothetical protein [Vibrio jasicida]|uniref:type I restriction endonuclease subunit M n=1 Tax=Vibrio jasicida TaxID=766224 RepID=UPI002895C8AD|nr:conserved hypothetical protein [Vibrio jasicida]